MVKRGGLGKREEILERGLSSIRSACPDRGESAQCRRFRAWRSRCELGQLALRSDSKLRAKLSLHFSRQWDL